VLHGLLALAEKHPVAQLEHSCQQAIEYGAWRLRDLRQLLDRPRPSQLSFLDQHPLIGDLEAYGNLVPLCFASDTENPKPSTQENESESP
jgi:hypothetical protein